MHIRYVYGFDLFTLVLVSCNLFIQFVNEVIIAEAGGFGCQDVVYDVVQVDMLDMHMVTKGQLLVAPFILTENSISEGIRHNGCHCDGPGLTYIVVRYEVSNATYASRQRYETTLEHTRLNQMIHSVECELASSTIPQVVLIEKTILCLANLLRAKSYF